MVSASLLATHSLRRKHTTHAQPHRACLFFGVDVSLDKGHQSSSSGVFTLVLPRGTTPDLSASSPCSHRARLKASKVGKLCGKGEQCDPLSTKHHAPPVEQACLFHQKPLWRRHLEVPLIIFCYHFRVVLYSRKASTSNTSLSHTPGFVLSVLLVSFICLSEEPFWRWHLDGLMNLLIMSPKKVLQALT